MSSAFTQDQLNSLLRVANYQEDSPADFVGSNNPMIAEIIARRQAAERDDAIENAADLIIQISNNVQEVIAAKTNELRELRRKETAILAELKEINRAAEYAAETGNYLPLVNALNYRHHVPKDFEAVVTKVPADWIPASKNASKADSPTSTTATKPKVSSRSSGTKS